MLMIGRHVSRLSGFAPAVPTPFNARDAVDTAVFGSFCDRQIADGATALVVAGTTGEASTLRSPERDALIRVAREVARGRVPVIAGAGSNSTERAIELTRNAAAAGADAVLSVVPYYNKPTQAGMRAHFQAIAEIVGPSRHPVRRTVAHGLRPRRGDDCAAGRAPAGDRPWSMRALGCGICALRLRSAFGIRFSPVLRRRRERSGVSCSGRGRVRVGDLERRSRPLSQPACRLGTGTSESRAPPRRLGRRTDRGTRRRKRSGAGQIRAQPARPDGAAGPSSTGRAGAGGQGEDRASARTALRSGP